MTSEQCLLAKLVGYELASVVFVRDYVQFVFEGPEGNATWSTYTWPTFVAPGARSIRHGDERYSDALLGLIGHRVASGVCTDASLVVGMSTGGDLRVSLLPDDYANDWREWTVW
jgi:hypothetical protein